MDAQRMHELEHLLLKKLEGKISEEELRHLESWAAENPENGRLTEVLSDREWMMEQMTELEAIEIPMREPAVVPLRRPSFFRRWGWAAAVLCLVGAGAALWLTRQPAVQRPPVVQAPAEPDVQPGHEGAILTLADGSEIPLDSTSGGEIARQGGSKLTLGKGQLTYDAGAHGKEVAEFNTITIPRGRQFRLLLPDGSKVWLNSASSIRFPVAFTGTTREVTVTGEAYFEVTENKQLPFIVNVPGRTSLRVLGTRFNVKAYPDETVTVATLLEGRLAVAVTGGNQAILNPGQQAVMEGTQLQQRNVPNAEAAVAWKNGLFNFDNKKLDEVMRELARWYDLEIVYEKGIPDIMFGGEMGRNEPLSNVLLGLQDASVKFRIDTNRRLVVLP
ncbi:FecR family protein [Chitinophaga sp. XS-30]|uniref:FecR family protein n=1 Tax=Chitinophaga sp. XS-30 TaxID=2604421 RepID=UPI0011DDB93C|nr:FecR family protein [Chitinophaga sp. XS-30]QEH43298.1 DUF4974 domain-containing protein [Chitinophaga sp. XS-30]